MRKRLMRDPWWEEFRKNEEKSRKDLEKYCDKINAQRHKEYLKRNPPYKLDLSNYRRVHVLGCA